MVLLVVGRHVAQFVEVALGDADREDFDVIAAKSLGDRTRIAAVRVAVGDKEESLLRVRTSGSEDTLYEPGPCMNRRGTQRVRRWTK